MEASSNDHHSTYTPLVGSSRPYGQNSESGEGVESSWNGEWVKSIVYAGLDAIVTSFSLISSISGGNLPSVDVLVLGVANLVADGISMGFGDYVSSSAENDMAAKEREATEWAVANRLGAEQFQLLRTYQSLGMEPADAMTVVNILAKYKDIFVEEKLTTEKGVLPPDQSEKPWKRGLITFVAFILFGGAPLLSYIILIPFTKNESVKFGGACLLSLLAAALLGLAKARIARQNYLISAVATVGNGAGAAASAYLIGWLLRNVAGLED